MAIPRPVRSLVVLGNRLGATPTGVAGRHHEIALGGGRQAGPSPALRKAAAGRSIVITGASSGIGRASADLLAAAGARVLLVARTEARLEQARAEIAAAGGTAHAYPCDLTDFEAVDTLVAEVLDRHGPVDVLVNNAGRSIRRRVASSAERFHDFERPMQLNYFAAIRLTLGLLPGMRERGSGQVINISTWAVQLRPARFSGYVASKAALEAWSDCVQGELVADGIDGIVFTTIRMPLVRTPMIAPTRVYRGLPALTAEQAARTVGDAVIRRPRRLRPPFGQALAVSEAISPVMTDRIRGWVM